MSTIAADLIERIREEVSGIRPRPMKRLFDIAKQHQQLDSAEIVNLLGLPEYEFRMAAVCVMDFQARNAKIPPAHLKELCDIYLSHHAQIDTWDMVDRAAPHVVGKYLFDKPREPLYQLARHGSEIEKRSAIVSTWYFIKHGQVEDTFALGKLLVNEKSDVVALAVGSWIREAGKRDSERLLSFLDEHASTMHRGALRAAIEKLPQPMRQHYLNL